MGITKSAYKSLLSSEDSYFVSTYAKSSSLSSDKITLLPFEARVTISCSKKIYIKIFRIQEIKTFTDLNHCGNYLGL